VSFGGANISEIESIAEWGIHDDVCSHRIERAGEKTGVQPLILVDARDDGLEEVRGLLQVFHLTVFGDGLPTLGELGERTAHIGSVGAEGGSNRELAVEGRE